MLIRLIAAPVQAFVSTLMLGVVLVSCRHETHISEFFGTYKIWQAKSLNKSKELMVKEAGDWTILLKDSGNFQIYGTGINRIGYWEVGNKGPDEYSLLFQGGGVTTRVRFTGKEIHFDKPDKLLDSLFSEAIFLKEEKE